MRTTAIINQKGGSGKTTTAINLASVYARQGLRTLLVDMDPQSHCAAGLGVPDDRIDFSIAEALIAPHDDQLRTDDLLWEVSRDLHLIPSTVRLATLEAPGGGLHMLDDKDRRLTSLLERLSDRFDRCLIDCPPTIGLLTYNALRASREALIPVETGYLAMKGAQRQWTTIRRLIDRIDQPIAVHVLPTIHDPNSRVAQDVLKALQRQFAGQIVPVVIHNHNELREAISFGQPIVEYAPHSKAHQDFERLAEWLESHEPAAGRGIVELELDPDMDAVHRARPMAPPTVGTPMTDASDVIRSRAEEMVRRVRELALRNAQDKTELDGTRPEAAPESVPESSPAVPAAAANQPTESTPSAESTESSPSTDPVRAAAPPTPVLVIDDAPANDESGDRRPDLDHLYGAQDTARGILFVQPISAGQTVAVAGDFNGWSTTRDILNRNTRVGVHERVIDMPEGQHRYRLVVDGRWVADSHNERTATNAHGETISIVERKAVESPIETEGPVAARELRPPVIESSGEAAEAMVNRRASDRDEHTNPTATESGVR